MFWYYVVGPLIGDLRDDLVGRPTGDLRDELVGRPTGEVGRPGSSSMIWCAVKTALHHVLRKRQPREYEPDQGRLRDRNTHTVDETNDVLCKLRAIQERVAELCGYTKAGNLKPGSLYRGSTRNSRIC